MEWISVKEKLPEPFVDVLAIAINLKGFSFEKGEPYMALDSFCIWNDEHSPSFGTDRFYGKVTHWMPLPPFPDK